jgi:GTP pyrophosphokinase
MLPRGATPIDFAYAIHTEVGHQCVGARVHGRMVPLRYRLENGDIVEILTSAGHKPSRDWLGLTVTNRAKSKIRHYLNTAEKQQALEIGRKHLERELRRFDLSLKKLAADKTTPIASAARDLGVGQKAEDIFAALGYGKISARQVLSRLLPPDRLEEQPDKPRPVVDAVKRFLRRRDERIKVKGTDDLLVYRAKCCNPIMGEPIVGYITRGKGVSVHSLNCANVKNLVYDPGRRIEVEWDRGAEGGYEVRLAVELEDRLGALAAVTASLASMKTDVRDMQVRTFDDNTASIVLTVRINDLKHLDKVVKSVRGVKGVIDVARQSVAGASVAT